MDYYLTFGITLLMMSYVTSCATPAQNNNTQNFCTSNSTNDCGVGVDCVDTKNSYYCKCQDGFVLSADQKQCKELNCACDSGWTRASPGKCFKYTASGRDEIRSQLAKIDNANENGVARKLISNYTSAFIGFRRPFKMAYTNWNWGEPNNRPAPENCVEMFPNSGKWNDINCADSKAVIEYYSCSCRDGYELSDDKKKCIDINECALGLEKCGHVGTCVNTEGSYRCNCSDGYELSADQKRCDFSANGGWIPVGNNKCFKISALASTFNRTKLCPGFSIAEMESWTENQAARRLIPADYGSAWLNYTRPFTMFWRVWLKQHFSRNYLPWMTRNDAIFKNLIIAIIHAFVHEVHKRPLS
ncbi:uncharacterized protein LOC141909702 isoform X2 [Tubulanus polymorphus]|uniref:uncharacterized protein LOC141909702 isoform X2 n=1 Tax=Tubulanus polymorphus TaxID=672921 RepID=UPI003DA6B1C8